MALPARSYSSLQTKQPVVDRWICSLALALASIRLLVRSAQAHVIFSIGLPRFPPSIPSIPQWWGAFPRGL